MFLSRLLLMMMRRMREVILRTRVMMVRTRGRKISSSQGGERWDRLVVLPAEIFPCEMRWLIGTQLGRVVW